MAFRTSGRNSSKLVKYTAGSNGRSTRPRVYDPMIGAGIADLIDERTKLVWVESPGSGTMEVQDVPAIVAAAKSRGALVGCDNTWASPLLFKPLAHGADFAIEALTKYVARTPRRVRDAVRARSREAGRAGGENCLMRPWRAFISIRPSHASNAGAVRTL